MKKKQFILMMALALFIFNGCSSTSKNDSEDLNADDVSASSDSPAVDSELNDGSSPSESNKDEFSDFEEKKDENQQAQQSDPQDELNLDSNQAQEQANNPPPAEPTPAPEPVVEAPPPVVNEPVAAGPLEIKNVQYKGNETGGTLVIDATGPLVYKTRSNPSTNQYVIEVENAILPDRLKRPLNMKDFKGGIGSIDAYQNIGTQTARFVLQMRPGAQEPILQAEGNSLLVATNDTALSQNISTSMGENLNSVPVSTVGSAGLADGSASGQQVYSAKDTSEGDSSGKQNILTNLTMEDYLADNTKFYGRKISCTFDNVDTQRALEFIMLDSGVNMILDDLSTIGTVNIRLREVPWDQCLVLIMKTKKLGYSRLGNVLRIAKQSELKAEEDEAVDRAQKRQIVEPLKVRIFPTSYAKATELVPQITPFLTKTRGAVTSDTRTNSVVVTDTEEVLTKIARIIKNLDTPPPQVMIEGKIVEASESFQKSSGINWAFGGQDMQITTNSQGNPVNIRPSFSFGAQAGSGSGSSGAATGFSLTVGTLDLIGDLTAQLSLFELEGKVKVLSSPRIVTMSNVAATISQSTTPSRLQITATSSGSQTSYTKGDPATVQLTVTPQVTNDSTVQMQVGVQRAFFGSPINASAPDSAPTFTRTAQTTVIVKNGQTSVIGGIFQDDTSEGEGGISGLKDIPILGSLFRSKTSRRDKNELLIFITPRIVDNGITPSDQSVSYKE